LDKPGEHRSPGDRCGVELSALRINPILKTQSPEAARSLEQGHRAGSEADLEGAMIFCVWRRDACALPRSQLEKPVQ